MAKSHRELTAVSVALRQAIKASGRKYRDLAVAAGVSERTVKRFLSGQQDVSISRLVDLCNVLNVDFFDLMKQAETPSSRPTFTLSERQEQYLLDHPQHYTYLLLLHEGLTPRDIMAKYQLTSRSNERYLRELEAQGFLERTTTGDRCVLRQKGRMIHVGSGPVAQAQMGEGVNRMLAFLNAERPNAIGGLVTASSRMSRASATACQVKLCELISYFHRQGRMDRSLPESEQIDVEWALGLAAPFKAFPRALPTNFEEPNLSAVSPQKRRRAG